MREDLVQKPLSPSSNPQVSRRDDFSQGGHAVPSHTLDSSDYKQKKYIVDVVLHVKEMVGSKLGGDDFLKMVHYYSTKLSYIVLKYCIFFG